MLLIDTSVWIKVFRDKTGNTGQQLQNLISDREIFLTHFIQLELLQGCRDEKEWVILNAYLQSQDYVDLGAESWEKAARIYYNLRRRGLTVRSSIDCCIAQAAIEHNLLLIHIDRDFETIASITSLNQIRFE